MKVIFIEDVPNVARAGQTREVANGYARNFLFPRKLAVLANSQAAASVESHLKKVAKQRAIEEAEMSELAKVITGTEITLKAKVGEKDKLYGSVTGADIAEALSKEIGREIDKRKVDLAEPIRIVGVYDVTIKFTHDITAMVTVTVMSDAEGAEKPVRVEKAEAPAEEKKEKAVKKEKKVKKEKAPEEPKEEKPAAAEKAEKPAKVKKPKKVKAVEPAEAEKPVKEEKKEKKSKAKAKKTEETVEENKE
ncbi:MAG: 50S ribosomal protein L9 [Chloroflexi bacterium RBG_13_51_18]|nr:MAG: 50S ribosomal protein L9 [Chloroflexi bacterium RBG_13_51_18]